MINKFGVEYLNIVYNYISRIYDYLVGLLVYEISLTKFLIIGFAVFILFELIIGWYVPNKHKYNGD